MELKEATKQLNKTKEIFEHLKYRGWINDIKRDVDASDVIDAIDTVLAELDKLNERIEYALAIAYDYDGYYNPETKQGNVEGLAMTIDDMVNALKGNLKGVE